MRKLSEVAIFTEHVEAVTTFYATVLDVVPIDRSEQTATFDVDGVTVFIHEAEKSREEDHIAFSVPDLDAACDALKAKGIAMRGPTDFPWGRSAYMDDPDGREIELHERKP